MGKKGEERAQELKLFREALQTLLLLLLLIRRAVKPLTKTENGGGRRGGERERERERETTSMKRGSVSGCPEQLANFYGHLLAARDSTTYKDKIS